jgi:hypothetical protein
MCAFQQLWTKDQLARLKEKGICGPKDGKLPRSELAERIALMEGRSADAFIVHNL